jgi:hypothetical protein
VRRKERDFTFASRKSRSQIKSRFRQENPDRKRKEEEGRENRGQVRRKERDFYLRIQKKIRFQLKSRFRKENPDRSKSSCWLRPPYRRSGFLGRYHIRI